MQLKNKWFVAILVAMPVAAYAAFLSAGIQPEYRIITFKPNTSEQQRFQIAEQSGCLVTHNLRLIDAISCEISEVTSLSVDKQLKAMPEVSRIDQDVKRPWLLSNAPSFSQTPFSDIAVEPFKARTQKPPRKKPGNKDKLQWNIDRVNAPRAWHVTKGRGVNVAIIDTGFDYTHPDLSANFKGGINLVTPQKKAKDHTLADVNAENPCPGMTNKTPDCMDDNGHGSHVAGIIAAHRAANGVEGVAPEANLYSAKVLDANGSGTFADVIAGIQWASEHHMDLANMSLGASQGNPDLAAAVDAAAKNGLTIIAAAGNDGGGPVGYPAAYPQVIAVSASNNRDEFAYFSSKGPEVAVIAPGDTILSTYSRHAIETPRDYAEESGTSMSCPHAVGVAALAVAAKKIHGVDQIRSALQTSATDLKLSKEEQGAGLVDAAKIVR